MPEKTAATKRRATRFEGVYMRESATRRHNGKPDISYTIDYRDANGRRIRKDVGWASEGFSAQYVAQLRQKLIFEAKNKATLGEERYQPESAVPTLAESFERYVRDWLEPRGKRTKNDKNLYHNHLAQLGEKRLSEIDEHAVDTLISELYRKGLSDQSVLHVAALLRRIMRRMLAWKLWRGVLPFGAVELPKPNNERKRYLTPQEAHDLLDEIKRHSEETWLISLIALHCGLRYSEIAALTRHDVSLRDRLLYIRESKGGQAREAAMTAELTQALSGWLDAHPGAMLFPARDGRQRQAVSKTYMRAVKALGLNNSGQYITVKGKKQPVEIKDARQRVVFHTLRHTYASWLALRGKDDRMIADRLGHASINTSRRYRHLMPEVRKATADDISQVFHSVTHSSEPCDEPATYQDPRFDT